jgi:EAL domain-containing protein (putative c-di-GMP-specific phosphodiesterase class I)
MSPTGGRDPLERQDYGPGEVIFREGEPGDVAFVVERGRVEISALRQGQDVVLVHLGEGELLGEMALIDEKVRSASARAIEATSLVVIHRDQVREKIESADPLLNLFLKVILERLRVTTRLVERQRQAAEDVEEEPSGSFKQVRDRAMSLLAQEQDLKRAVERREFMTFFQPIVDTADGSTAGFEALIRWLHPDRGLLGPGAFVDFAEQTGMIVPMGIQVLESACSALGRLQGSYGGAFPSRPPLFMGVNLSTRQVGHPELIDQVRAIVEGSAIDPGNLKLEVTESVLMGDPETAISVLRQLKDLGVQLAVDDFGTGYSSLSYLHRFPIDVLKVDRSFVSTMLSDSGSLKIVRTITRLAKELGLKVVAEGVERREEWTVISDLGCELAQGYYFSKPRPLNDVEQLVLEGPLGAKKES